MKNLMVEAIKCVLERNDKIELNDDAWFKLVELINDSYTDGVHYLYIGNPMGIQYEYLLSWNPFFEERFVISSEH